jgi:glyoxylase-like metal-dependent hydrolase (beta-lactamase superfamily II)
MKINDSVYLLESTKGAYVYLIKGKENILIDTGFPWQGNAILKELEKLGIKLHGIKHILLTHYDIDHIGNAVMLQNLTKAQLWASKEEIPYINGSLDRPGFKKYLPYIFRVNKPKNIKPYRENRNINDIKIISTPGHTPGHVCLLYKDVFFVGDLFENKNGTLRPYPKSWNWNQSLMMKSIDKISKLSYKWICPAHGSPIKK